MEKLDEDIARLNKLNESMLRRINDNNCMITHLEEIVDNLLAIHIDTSDYDGVLKFPCLQNTQKAKKCIRQLYEITKEEFKDYGTEISINGFPTTDKDEWIQQRDVKAIRYAIAKYIKDTGRQIHPKMVCIYEHATKYHFHGIFRGIPNDCVDYIRKICSKRCGRIEISMINNQDSYIDYMFKSYIEECRIRFNNSVDEFIKTNKNPKLRPKQKIELLEDYQEYDSHTIGL